MAMSQLSFTVFGTIFNNILFNALKETPGIPASNYHVLLLNLTLSNLLVSNIVKPMSSIYISYAFAKVAIAVFSIDTLFILNYTVL